MKYYKRTKDGFTYPINEWAYKAMVIAGARIVLSEKHVTIIKDATK
jgi:hypothetical protein